MKQLLDEKLTLEVPVLFAELYGLNPMNFQKWIPGAKKAKGKFGDITISELAETKVDITLEEDGLLLDVIVGKDEHKLLIKKPSVEKGVDLILEEVGEFKIEVNFIVTEVDEKRCSLEVIANVLDHKRSFHPIFDFEIKYFLKKAMHNFAEECQESFNTLEAEAKSLEAEILSFYHWNVKQLQTIITPVEKDLGEDFKAEIQAKFKKLSADNAERVQALFQEIIDIIPEDDKNTLVERVTKDIKNCFNTVTHLNLEDHAGTLNNIHSALQMHLETFKYVVPTLLKDISGEKIVEIQREIIEIFQNNLAVISGIIEEIKAKLPPQDIKNIEKALVDLLRKDIDSSKNILGKLSVSEETLDNYEKKVVETLKETLDAYEESLNKDENSHYVKVMNMTEKSMKVMKDELTKLGSEVTEDQIQHAKKVAALDADSIFSAVGDVLKATTPKNIEANKPKFEAKIDEILGRYAQAAKLINPKLEDEKVKEIKDKIEKTLKDEYASFIKK